MTTRIWRFVSFVGLAFVMAISQVGVASAVTTPPQLCTVDSFNGCWRDQNNLDTADNPVVIANKCSGGCPATGIQLVDQHVKYDGFEVYQIKFAAHPSLCIGVKNDDTYMETRTCSAHGTAWAKTNDRQWINRGASEDIGQKMYACSFNVNGDRMFVGLAGCSNTVFTLQ